MKTAEKNEEENNRSIGKNNEKIRFKRSYRRTQQTISKRGQCDIMAKLLPSQSP